MRKIAILGSTGSIGTNTLRVIETRPSDFKVIGLGAYQNVKVLAKQIKLFKPKLISVKDEETIKQLEKFVSLSGIKVYTQEEGLKKIAIHPEVEMVVVATAGTISLVPTLQAIEEGKTIALANKEPLVMAGEIVMSKLKRKKSTLIPIDSEHSAIFQCLQKENKNSIRRIYLTGTGGPFHNLAQGKLKDVSAQMALDHPKWKMGKKITIDSATLMNKGLEIIEARWLFDVAPDKIEVLIHPEAIIHSLVEFCDGSILAQLGITDMRLPIQYALDYPRRKISHLAKVSFLKIKKLTFAKPDLNKFPCLKIAQRVAREGGTNGCVMSAANEIAVNAFLNGKIRFTDIPKVINKVLQKHHALERPTLDEILALDHWAKKEARLFCYPQ